MKQISINLLLLLPLFWLAGCNSDDDETTHTEGKPGTEVKFDISFDPIARVSTDAEFNSQFEDGDEIGVFASKEGTSDFLANNVKLVRRNGQWEPATDADKIFYPLNGKRLRFYAYYPYQGNHDIYITNMSFEVLADQSTAANYSKSDILAAITLYQSDGVVSLSFTHLMAMVQVTVNRNTPVPAFKDGADGLKVTLKNVKRSAEGYWDTKSLSAPTVAPTTDITMYRVPTTDGSWVFRALIPQQNIPAGKMFAFEQTLQGNVIDMGYTTTSVAEFKMYKASTYKVTLDYQLDPNHVYAKGDAYPCKGTPVGIVYYTTSGGKNGRVVSLDEAYLTWGPTNVITNTNGSYGQDNMNEIKDLNPDFSDYPAFAWCDQKNAAAGTTTYSGSPTDIWFLPTNDELGGSNQNGFFKNFYDFGSDNFNTQLTNAGSTAIGTNASDWYWSSTNRPSMTYEALGFGPTGIGWLNKDEFHRVRAIMEF